LEIIERIEGCLGRPVAKNFLPARDVDVPANVLCIERAKQELGWTPKILFADGVARAVAECKRDLGIV
jgi:nucleoside-diphosphate-sugar epimerase